MVGYLCPGTCLDYAYKTLNVPYSFAFEIYERDANFKKFNHHLKSRKLSNSEKIRLKQ